MSQPAYPGALPVAVVQERLAEAAENSDQEFWPDDVNLLKKDGLVWTKVLGDRQVTGAYLVIPEQPARVAYLFVSRGIQVMCNLPEFNLSSADSLQYETT